MKFQLLAEHFLGYYVYVCNAAVYCTMVLNIDLLFVCVDWSVIFVNVININHRLLMQSFIHSALRLGPEHLIQHFRILLAIISYEHKHTHTHTQTGEHS